MNKPILDSSKFRFRVGDIVRWGSHDCEIVGYFFTGGFNNFNENYGYIILRPDNAGHDGSIYGFDEYGHNFMPSLYKNCWYVREKEISNKVINNQNEKTKKNGNEIKLQRTKVVISRGTVPTGYRICSKVHKTAISSQPLSYTEVVRGS